MGSPSKGWHMPFVTGHRYKVSWGASGLDFETIQVRVEQNWASTDLPIEIVHNHTDTRVYINATQYDEDWLELEQIANETYLDSSSSWVMGSNIHYPEEDTQMFYYVVTGVDPTIQFLKLEGSRCWDTCVDDMENSDISDVINKWSD